MEFEFGSGCSSISNICISSDSWLNMEYPWAVDSESESQKVLIRMKIRSHAWINNTSTYGWSKIETERDNILYIFGVRLLYSLFQHNINYKATFFVYITSRYSREKALCFGNYFSLQSVRVLKKQSYVICRSKFSLDRPSSVVIHHNPGLVRAGTSVSCIGSTPH